MIPTVPEKIAFEITKAAISSIVKPTLTAAFSGLKTLTTEAISKFSDLFSDYLIIQAERHSKISTIVFGHQKSLADLYIPLTLRPEQITEKRSEIRGIFIDRFHTELFPKENRVLITDTAGMGKSTLSKFLFLQCLKSCYAIPFFIELRHLSTKNTAEIVILKQLNTRPIGSDEQKFSKRQFERILKKGGLVIFFDGYDEIPFKDRESVTKDIKQLIEVYPNNIFVITSRPESGLLAFPAFKQFSIKPLQKEESFSLIKKYDQGGGRADQLISKLTGRDFKAVEEFLKNPLLTSLLYRSFEYKQNIPIKKHIFYRQVFDALFDWHDSSKDGYNTREKKSGLDVDSFHRVLRIIGFVSVMKGQIEGDTDAVLGWIRKSREVCVNLTFSESDFLDDLVRAVPIFAKDGDFYRWSHKSLAEYFAAQYICTEGKNQQDQILSAFLSTEKSRRFSNVLDQIYDIDTAGFRKNLSLPLAKEFSKYWNESYKNLNPQITQELIRLRKEIHFDKILITIPYHSLDFNDLTESINNLLKQIPQLNINIENSEFSLLVIDTQSGDVERLLLIITGPYSTIIDILDSKSDPLVRKIRNINMPRSKSKSILGPAGKPYLIDESSNSIHNKYENFNKTTELIFGFNSPINSDRMLAFEASFRDSEKLSDLADELLKSISKKTS